MACVEIRLKLPITSTNSSPPAEHLKFFPFVRPGDAKQKYHHQKLAAGGGDHNLFPERLPKINLIIHAIFSRRKGVMYSKGCVWGREGGGQLADNWAEHPPSRYCRTSVKLFSEFRYRRGHTDLISRPLGGLIIFGICHLHSPIIWVNTNLPLQMNYILLYRSSKALPKDKKN